MLLFDLSKRTSGKKKKKTITTNSLLSICSFFSFPVIATHVLCSQHGHFFTNRNSYFFLLYIYKSISKPLHISPQVGLHKIPKQNFLNFQNTTTTMVFARALLQLQNPFCECTCYVAWIHTIPDIFGNSHIRWRRSCNSL